MHRYGEQQEPRKSCERSETAPDERGLDLFHSLSLSSVQSPSGSLDGNWPPGGTLWLFQWDPLAPRVGHWLFGGTLKIQVPFLLWQFGEL